MARSLEGKWFHTCYNNGVEAVVSHEVMESMQKKRSVMLVLENMSKGNGGQVDMLPHTPDTPIFTFTTTERAHKSPWFTGTTSSEEYGDFVRLLNYITRNGGHFGGSSFRVPFSNGSEMGIHGPEAQLEELRYVTTNAQFKDTFGISLSELRESGNKYL